MKRKLTERELLKVTSDRKMEVYKRDDMLQKGRHELSLQEQRCVLYAISKIKPSDTVFEEYTFELSEFYKMCGLSKESYTDLKAILYGLRQKSWWVDIDGEESTVSWFNKVRTNKKNGTVTVRFDDDMMPFLLELSKQKAFYTHFQLKYILPMKSQYAIRLYELLKSYQKNNLRWFFDIEELKIRLNCENYSDFYDFKRRVLEPAVAEINQYTDIIINWDTEKEGRKVTRIVFMMFHKKANELYNAEIEISKELDGENK